MVSWVQNKCNLRGIEVIFFEHIFQNIFHSMCIHYSYQTIMFMPFAPTFLSTFLYKSKCRCLQSHLERYHKRFKARRVLNTENVIFRGILVRPRIRTQKMYNFTRGCDKCLACKKINVNEWIWTPRLFLSLSLYAAKRRTASMQTQNKSPWLCIEQY